MMNPTTLNSTVRELDCRTNNHIEVRLLWNSLTDSVSVSVRDTPYGESFQLDVAPAHALEAFHHPFAYAGNHHDPRSTRPSNYPLGAARKGRTMISADLIYQVGLERIDDLRREAEAWRCVKLARAELHLSPSTTEKERHL